MAAPWDSFLLSQSTASVYSLHPLWALAWPQRTDPAWVHLLMGTWTLRWCLLHGLCCAFISVAVIKCPYQRQPLEGVGSASACNFRGQAVIWGKVKTGTQAGRCMPSITTNRLEATKVPFSPIQALAQAHPLPSWPFFQICPQICKTLEDLKYKIEISL